MTVFDLVSVLLFVATLATFVWRTRYETVPLMPYGLISCVCIVTYWLGEHGAGAWAIGLLMGAAFLLLHLGSLPFAEEDNLDLDIGQV